MNSFISMVVLLLEIGILAYHAHDFYGQHMKKDVDAISHNDVPAKGEVVKPVDTHVQDENPNT